MGMAITGFLQAAPAQAGQAPKTGGATEGEFPEMLAEVSAEGAIGQLEAILAEFVRLGNETEGAGERTEAVQPETKAEDWIEQLNIVAAEAMGNKQIAIPIRLDGATTKSETGAATDAPEPGRASLPIRPVEALNATNVVAPLPVLQLGSAGLEAAAEFSNQAPLAPETAIPGVPDAPNLAPRDSGGFNPRQINLPDPRSLEAPNDAPTDPVAMATGVPPSPGAESETALALGLAKPPANPPESIVSAPEPIQFAPATRLSARIERVERRLAELLQKAGVEPYKAAEIVGTVRAFVETTVTAPARTTLEMLVAKLVETTLPQPMKEALSKITPKTTAVNSEAASIETASVVESPRGGVALTSQFGASLEDSVIGLLGKPQQNSQMQKLSLADASVISDPLDGVAPPPMIETAVVAHQNAAATLHDAPVSDPIKTLTISSVANRVIEQVQKWMDDDRNKSITIRLDPPELGSLNVTVRTIGSRVETTILASSGDVRAWIEQNRSDLSNALAKSGLELGSMSVGAEARQHSQAQRGESALRQPIWRPEPQPVLERDVFTSQWRRSALDYRV